MVKLFRTALLLTCALGVAAAAATADDNAVGSRNLRGMGKSHSQLNADVTQGLSDPGYLAIYDQDVPLLLHAKLGQKASLQGQEGQEVVPEGVRPDAATDDEAPKEMERLELEALVHAVDAAHAQRSRFVRMEALRRSSHNAHMATAGLTTFQQSKKTAPKP